MPIYEYQCQKCGEISEIFLRTGEKAPKKCETCDGKLKRIISAAGFQFKGTGWYVTDYARKGKKDPAESESTGAAPAVPAKTGTTAGAASEPKTETKPSTVPAPAAKDSKK